MLNCASGEVLQNGPLLSAVLHISKGPWASELRLYFRPHLFETHQTMHPFNRFYC